MPKPPVTVWHLFIDDPHGLYPDWHPREAHYTDEDSARAHVEMAKHLGGEPRLFRAAPTWVEVPE